MTAVIPIDGTDENDRFVFNFDSDTIQLVNAGHGADFISDGKNNGYWSADLFRGQMGDDTLISRVGDDRLFGGLGDDNFIVRVSWVDPGAVPTQIPLPHSTLAFDVTVMGGRGDDILTITNSAGSTVEHDGGDTIVHTRFGGSVTAHGIEHILML